MLNCICFGVSFTENQSKNILLTLTNLYRQSAQKRRCCPGYPVQHAVPASESTSPVLIAVFIMFLLKFRLLLLFSCHLKYIFKKPVKLPFMFFYIEAVAFKVGFIDEILMERDDQFQGNIGFLF